MDESKGQKQMINHNANHGCWHHKVKKNQNEISMTAVHDFSWCTVWIMFIYGIGTEMWEAKPKSSWFTVVVMYLFSSDDRCGRLVWVESVSVISQSQLWGFLHKGIIQHIITLFKFSQVCYLLISLITVKLHEKRWHFSIIFNNNIT